MNSYFQKILQKIRTTADAARLSEQIDTVLNDLFTLTNGNMANSIDENLSQELGSEIKSSFIEHGLSWEHHEEVKSYFLTLKEELSKCKVITLTLAYHPTEKQLKRLKNWTITQLEGNHIFEIEHDESILGGTIMIINGHYLDLSLKKKIEEHFKNYQKPITKVQ